MRSVEIRNLNKHYAQFHALRDIDLSLNEGEFAVMVGPSGCGKSTLLRTIAGLEDATSGQILVNGRDVTDLAPRDRGLAMVFQNYALYPHLTVAQNMGFALRLARRPKAEIEAAVSRAAQILQLTDLLDKKPRHLSGGQRQRVAIGRAITRAPDVFLFDEPLSNLDAALRAQMRVELTSLHRSLGASMIYVTHDQVEAMTMASRIVLMRNGVVEQVGAPLELYNRPANLFAAGFLGSPKMNFFDVRLEERTEQHVRVVLPNGGEVVLPAHGWFGEPQPRAGDKLRLGIRPEHLLVDAERAGTGALAIEATVELEERLGRETVLYTRSEQLTPTGSEQPHIVIQRNVQSDFQAGDKVTVSFASSAVTVFREDGRTVRWADTSGGVSASMPA